MEKSQRRFAPFVFDGRQDACATPRAAARSGRLPAALFALVLCFASGLLRADGDGGRAVALDIPILTAGYGSAFFEETAREFERLRPGVRVNISGDARVHEKVRIRVMADEPPDATDAVLLYDTLIGSGRILDLAPWLDGPNWEGDARWRDTFLPGVLDRWTRESGAGCQPVDSGGMGDSPMFPPHEHGRVARATSRAFALPFAHAVWVVFYNEGLFEARGWSVPRTWDEFFALCEDMRGADVAPLTLPGVYMRYGDAFLRAAHYNLAGPEGFRAYQELMPGAYNDPRFVRAAEVLRRVSAGGLLRGWEGMTHTAAQQAFLDGRAAMTVSASWFVSEMRGKIPAGFRLGAFNLPVFADGEPAAAGGSVAAGSRGATGAVQAQSAYYFLFATGDAERERATVDFFRFLTSRERARAFARTLDAPVALRAVRPEDYASHAMRQIAAMTRDAPAVFDSAPPASAEFQALISQAMTDAREQLMTGRATAAEFGAQLEAAAARERARAADPGRVEARHPLKAAALLLAVAALAGGWLGGARTRGGRPAAKAPPEGRGGGAGKDAALPARATRGRRATLRPAFAAGFVGPALALFGAFVIAPGAASLAWAFTRWDGFSERSWAGLFNFKWLLLESDTFWFALKNNLYLMVVPTLFVVPLALVLAALIHRGVRGAGVFRAVFLFPNLLGGIAATLLWMHAYDPHGGLVNAALARLGAWTGIGWLQAFEGFAWLSPENLYRALIPIYLWMACGFNLVLYLAAMQGINPELYEAAELDGASAARQFFTITLPLIRGVLAISAVFIVIAGLNTFEMVWLLTSQDPASGSHVLSTLMVSTMFKEFQIGRATAIAVVMFVLVMAGSALVLRAMKTREEPE
ncbi:extracellular solute-binding protein [Termitidicoccus mucosus]|uniref:extracellular solute-binding protein n=1 Tax=Termitidicoccus mucosus TaxID=1184151 RepID=UPI003182D327